MFDQFYVNSVIKFWVDNNKINNISDKTNNSAYNLIMKIRYTKCQSINNEHNIFILRFALNYWLISVLTDDEPNCVIYNESGKEFSYDEWNNGIEIDQIPDTTAAETIIKTFKTKNTPYIYSNDVNGKYSYLKVAIPKRGNEFYIQIRDGFNKYEENEVNEIFDQRNS